MKLIKKCLPLGLLLLLSVSGFADTAGTGSDFFGGMLSFFSVPHSDESMALLGMLFGGMGEVLPGAPSVMGAMFAKFNASILVLTTLVFLYTMLMGLVSTAQDGEFLGKKYSSVWTPIRVVTGIGLLVPLKSGYCVLQIVLMWCVIQGIGAADTVWNAAVDFIELHSIYRQENFEATKSNSVYGTYSSVMTYTQRFTTSMFVNNVCMYQTYKSSGGSSQALNVTPIVTAKGYLYNFPSYKTGADGKPVIADYSGCGTFSMPMNEGGPNPNSLTNQANNAAADAMAEVMPVLNQAGREYAYNVPNATSTDGLDTQVPGQPITAAEEYFADHVTQAIYDWIDKYDADQRNAQAGDESALADSDQSKTFLNAERHYGWIYAGAFYKQLAVIQPTYAAMYLFNHFDAKEPTPGKVSGYANRPSDEQIAILSQTADAGDSGSNLLNLKKPPPYKNDLDMPNEGEHAFNVFNDMVHDLVTDFVGNLSGYNPKTGLIEFQSGNDPVIQMQILGQQIIQEVEYEFNVLFGIAVAFVIAAALVSCLGSFFGILLKIIGFFGMICAMFYSIGLSMTVYIPMVPFIIFLFGAIGWMVAVIETMLAAPLVAIGIVYPEGGHELLGRAAPAAMLVTNVFLRPTFMIFGLIAGMLITYIGVTLLNTIYQFVVYSNSYVGLGALVNGGTVYSGVTALQWALYMAVYVSIVMVIINKAYALIHKLPDNVLRWIGGQAGFGEYSGGAEEVGSKVNKFTDQAGQSTGSAMGGMSAGASSVGGSLSQDLK